MPHTARKRKGPKGKPWAIVRRDTGKVVGHSTSKRKAKASARARDAAAHGWKPTRKR